jgi:hypothetical protein
MGPRASGKTTYLASLLYLHEFFKDEQKLKFNIQPLNEDAKELSQMAKAILIQQDSFIPTFIINDFYDIPVYPFKIDLKKRIFFNLFSNTESIDLFFRDYPGEIFDDLASRYHLNPIVEEYIEEVFRADNTGCFILLNRWRQEADKLYGEIMYRFIQLMKEQNRSQNFKIAVAMSKCDRIELWAGRLNPENYLFEFCLPSTTQMLRSKLPPENLRFFAISSFGVLGKNDPRPNRTIVRDGLQVLKDPSSWQPYNMIEPIYWLSTGKSL